MHAVTVLHIAQNAFDTRIATITPFSLRYAAGRIMEILLDYCIDADDSKLFVREIASLL